MRRSRRAHRRLRLSSHTFRQATTSHEPCALGDLGVQARPCDGPGQLKTWPGLAARIALDRPGLATDNCVQPVSTPSFVKKIPGGTDAHPRSSCRTTTSIHDHKFFRLGISVSPTEPLLPYRVPRATIDGESRTERSQPQPDGDDLLLRAANGQRNRAARLTSGSDAPSSRPRPRHPRSCEAASPYSTRRTRAVHLSAVNTLIGGLPPSN